jgi:hypothetical protein
MSEFFKSPQFIAGAIAFGFQILLAIMYWIFRPRAKVLWAVSHQNNFPMPATQGRPPGVICVVQIWVQNDGRSVADKVDIAFEYEPEHLKIDPRRQFEIVEHHGAGHIIRLDHLNPQELVAFSMIRADALPPLVTSIRWHGGEAKLVPVAPGRTYPMWWIKVRIVMFGIGLFAVLYSVVRVAQFLITP